MKTPVSKILADAKALSNGMSNLQINTGTPSPIHAGAAGRRRAGQGEDFWQYRHYNTEDSTSRIDWRKSGRGDQLYVRDTELETSRTFLFWSDPSPGFDWRGSPVTPTKAGRALTILAAIAFQIGKVGNRCGALADGRPANSGTKAAQNMTEDLWRLDATTQLPSLNKNPASIFIASDFYRPLGEISDWIEQLASKNKNGFVLMINDPIEASYPYEGRIRFRNPNHNSDRLIGRAENLKEVYLQKFQQRREDIKKLVHSVGWEIALHQTDAPAEPICHELAIWLKRPSNEAKRTA